METELKTILCIDDDPDILTIARVALETFGGLTTATCSSGREGIREAQAWQPNLILMDVMMPDLDGPATLELLRRDSSVASRIPVVFMTARVERSDVDNYLALGAAAVIAKPFDPLTLSGDLNTIWRRLAA